MRYNSVDFWSVGLSRRQPAAIKSLRSARCIRILDHERLCRLKIGLQNGPNRQRLGILHQIIPVGIGVQRELKSASHSLSRLTERRSIWNKCVKTEIDWTAVRIARRRRISGVDARGIRLQVVIIGA